MASWPTELARRYAGGGRLRRLRQPRRDRPGGERRGVAASGRRPLLRRVRPRGGAPAMAEQPGTYFLTDFLARTLRAHGVALAGARPPSRPARCLLRQLHPGGLAGAAAHAAAGAGRAARRPRCWGCRSRCVEVGEGGLERRARADGRGGTHGEHARRAAARRRHAASRGRPRAGRAAAGRGAGAAARQRRLQRRPQRARRHGRHALPGRARPRGRGRGRAGGRGSARDSRWAITSPSRGRPTAATASSACATCPTCAARPGR